MLRKIPSVRSTVPLLSVLAPAMVLGLAFASLDPGADLEQGLNAAARAEVILAADLPAAPAPAQAFAPNTIEEGSEAFWLTRAPDTSGVARVAWTAPVAPGDHIVANFGALDRQVLEVVTVDDAAAGETPTRIQTGSDSAPRFLLTCRNETGELVRLVVDAAGRGITAVGAADRSL